MTTTQSSAPVHVIGRPFPKGKSGNPGGLSKKVRAFRRDCEKLLPKAVVKLEALLDSSDPDDFKFALEWLRKAFIPVPKEVPADAAKSAGAPSMPASVASVIARMQ